jgi:peptidoglycan/xylan/chitin deacetylase (PgdA/CDA1 family)
VVIVIVILVILLLVGYWLLMSPHSQILGKYNWEGNTDKKVVAITFDDGPNDPYTSQILDILDELKVKATFFQVGKCVERYPETTLRAFRSGHVIANHSVSHEFHNYFMSLSFKKEIIDNQKIIQNHIGKRPALFRSPWLWRQPFLLRTLRLNNLVPVSGEFCHPLEVFQIDSNKIAKSAIKKAKPGSIIIFHDGFDGRGGNRSQSIEAAKITIKRLKESGYAFVTVAELLGVPAYQQ